MTPAAITLALALLVHAVAVIRSTAKWEAALKSHEREIFGEGNVPGLRKRMHDAEGRILLHGQRLDGLDRDAGR